MNHANKTILQRGSRLLQPRPQNKVTMNEQQVSQASRIASLIVKRVQEKLTSDEKEELDAWLQEDKGNAQLFEELTDNSRLSEAIDELNVYDTEAAYVRLSGKIFGQAPSPVSKRGSSRVWRYIAVAALTLIAGSIMIYFLTRKKAIAASSEVNRQHIQNVQPGKNKAGLVHLYSA